MNVLPLRSYSPTIACSVKMGLDSECFSFASWQDVKLYLERGLGWHCRRKFSFLELGCVLTCLRQHSWLLQHGRHLQCLFTAVHMAFPSPSSCSIDATPVPGSYSPCWPEWHLVAGSFLWHSYLGSFGVERLWWAGSLWPAFLGTLEDGVQWVPVVQHHSEFPDMLWAHRTWIASLEEGFPLSAVSQPLGSGCSVKLPFHFRSLFTSY